ADKRDARPRIAFDAVDMRQFLQLLLDLVGDLFFHFRRGRAGPGNVDDHHLDREGRVFGTAEVEVGVDTGAGQHDYHEQDERAVRDGPGGQVEALHDAGTPSVGSVLLRGPHARKTRLSYLSSMLRTLSPGSSFCTPSVTTFSPAEIPPVMSASSSLNDATVTGRSISSPESLTT